MLHQPSFPHDIAPGRGVFLKPFLLAALVLLSACAPRPQAPSTPTTPDAREQDMRGFFVLEEHDGQPVSRYLPAQDLAGLLSGADYVLVGETHTSICDHQMQANVLWTLADSGHEALVGLEMVDSARQDILDRFNRGDMPVQGEGSLYEALDWDATWGHPYGPYVPVFETARSRGLELYGLNTPKELEQFYREMDEPEDMSSLPEPLRPYMPSEMILSPDAQRDTLAQVFAMHSHARDEGENGGDSGLSTRAQAMLERFIRIQSLWDTTMAENSVRLHREKGLPVVILAGTGHVENGWGIAHRLRRFDPQARILLVMPWRDLGPLPDSGLADLFFFCPSQEKTRLGMLLALEEGRVLVQDVEPDSKADAAGILPGDIITHAGDMAADDLSVLHKAAMEAARNGEDMVLALDRHGETLTLAIPLGEAE